MEAACLQAQVRSQFSAANKYGFNTLEPTLNYDRLMLATERTGIILSSGCLVSSRKVSRVEWPNELPVFMGPSLVHLHGIPHNF